MTNSLECNRIWRRNLLYGLFLSAFLFGAATFGNAQTVTKTASKTASNLTGLSIAEFSRMIRDFSEEGGYFLSDNFTSNEDSYLSVVDKMRQLGATGGAYIGVGPEQNFTYIAKIRPRIAFIVDIRRQAMIQHLMNKAIFHLSPTRVDFLSILLSRPLDAKAPGANDPIDKIISYFSSVTPSKKAYAANLAAIRKAIMEDFQCPLSAEDQGNLEYVYHSFFSRGFNIGFDINDPGGRRFGHLPNLKEILAQRDLNEKQGSFLAVIDDYNFVRDMQRRNMIIPIVGDFAGKKALAQVAAYLRKNKYTLTVFYLSNVEIVLLEQNGTDMFADFVDNVRKMPSNDKSLLIRSTFAHYGHPTTLPGYALCTMLQSLPVFLRDFDQGKYPTYRHLIMTHYIQAYTY
jgi:hypothetical protein